MLTSDFKTELDLAAPEQPVTGILSWKIDDQKLHDRAYLTRIESLKRAWLIRLGSVAGVRVNPLHGMPQAIVQASAETWRELIRDNAPLQERDEVELSANNIEFHTQDRI